MTEDRNAREGESLDSTDANSARPFAGATEDEDSLARDAASLLAAFEQLAASPRTAHPEWDFDEAVSRWLDETRLNRPARGHWDTAGFGRP